MRIKVYDTHKDIRIIEVDDDETEEKTFRIFINDLQRGRWFTDVDGWKLSPVHIVRVIPFPTSKR